MAQDPTKIIDHSAELNPDEAPDPNLGDDVKLEPSPYYQGFSAAVAMKDEVHVCWNCFEPLGAQFFDTRMGNSIIRICRNDACLKKVVAANAKRRGERTKVTVPGQIARLDDALSPEETRIVSAAAKKITGKSPIQKSRRPAKKRRTRH